MDGNGWGREALGRWLAGFAVDGPPTYWFPIKLIGGAADGYAANVRTPVPRPPTAVNYEYAPCRWEHYEIDEQGTQDARVGPLGITIYRPVTQARERR